MYKAVKNLDVWLLPVLTAYSQQAWSEIEERLDWALRYISKNATKSQQRKSKKDRTLDGSMKSSPLKVQSMSSS